MRSIVKIIFLMIFVNASAFAKEAFYGSTSLSSTQSGDVSIYGSLDASRAQFENLVLMGNLNFMKVKVIDTLTVNGSLEGKGLDANRLVLNGLLNGNKIIIRNDATINGGLDAEQLDVHGYLTINTMPDAPFRVKRSNFEKVVASSKKIEFDEVIADSIEFDKTSKNAELYLKNGSLVKGDIIFKSGDGVIHKSSDSKIEGKVKGGIVQSIN